MATVIFSEVSKISIKKLLIIIIISTVLISVTLFAYVSNKYVNEYFDDYIENLYSENENNIIQFAKLALTDGKQQRMFLNSYVSDPIYYTEIYDNNDTMIINSGSLNKAFAFDESTMQIERTDIIDNGSTLGHVLIVRAKNIAYTNTKQVFVKAIYNGAIIAIISLVIIMGIIGVLIIRYVSNDTKKIVKYATDEEVKIISSKISEYSEIINAIKNYRNRLSIKEKVKKEKFDRILHETKTPLTVLKIQLEGVVDGIINIDKTRAEEMAKQIEKLDYILKDATTIIEGNEPIETLEISQADYSENITKIINSLKIRFNKKELALNYEKQPFIVETDVRILDNAIYNLLMNSYKYTAKGSVSIKTYDNCLEISDTGLGITPQDLDKVFDPYFRGSNIVDISGEGLGLYNVKNDLTRLHIDITVESEINKFTKFKLVFKEA